LILDLKIIFVYIPVSLFIWYIFVFECIIYLKYTCIILEMVVIFSVQVSLYIFIYWSDKLKKWWVMNFVTKKNDDASIKMDFCCTWMNKKKGKDNR
jgi:hypothetical protein